MSSLSLPSRQPRLRIDPQAIEDAVVRGHVDVPVGADGDGGRSVLVIDFCLREPEALRRCHGRRSSPVVNEERNGATATPSLSINLSCHLDRVGSPGQQRLGGLEVDHVAFDVGT